MTPTFAELAKSQYILLTTFTKDGKPKPTPIWAAASGDRLLVITQEKSWKVKRIRNTPRVTGFVGSGETPTPLSEKEVDDILNRVTTSADRPKPKLVFERNEQVRIIEGPFANFTGVVDDVNADRNTLKVSVTIFGRSTPVELDFVQVEKMA